MNRFLIGLAIGTLTSITACSQNKSDNNSERRQPPSMEQLMEKMDTNKDQKLSKAEVKGPLADQFSQIDTNKDGFLSKTELENAPKPERGQGRPPRR
jgi:Ca2+-binding EF-hand superfamily protein